MAKIQILKRYKSPMHGNYSRAGLRYGLILGVVLCFVLLIRFLIGYAPNAPVSTSETWTVFITMLIGNGVMIVYYRNLLEERKITFREAYLLCLIADIVACVIYAMFMYIYAVKIDVSEPSFLQRSIEVLVTNFTQKNEPVPDMSQYKISFLSMSSLMYNCVMSVLSAFIAALILRNEKAQIYAKEK